MGNLAAQFLYVFKACYFIVSSLQIVSGYPVRVIGNFLTSSYNFFSCKTSDSTEVEVGQVIGYLGHVIEVVCGSIVLGINYKIEDLLEYRIFLVTFVPLPSRPQALHPVQCYNTRTHTQIDSV